MLVCWKSDGYRKIYQIFEALSLYTILFNYSTFYLGFVGITFFMILIELIILIILFPCSDEFLAFREKLQRRQRIRIIFLLFPHCRSPPPPCPPPSARPYSSWSSRQIHQEAGGDERVEGSKLGTVLCRLTPCMIHHQFKAFLKKTLFHNCLTYYSYTQNIMEGRSGKMNYV